MSEQEIQFLRENIKEICAYKGIQEELTYDVPLKILKRICLAMDFLQQENNQLKERIAYLERSNERKEETIIDYQISEYSILEKLKNWLESDETKSIYTFETGRCFNYRDILNKIKELEEGVK